MDTTNNKGHKMKTELERLYKILEDRYKEYTNTSISESVKRQRILTEMMNIEKEIKEEETKINP